MAQRLSLRRLWLTSSLEITCEYVPVWRSRKELGFGDAQDAGKPMQYHDGRILNAAFDATDVVHGYLGLIGQGLLGQPFSQTGVTEIEADQPQNVHGGRQGDCPVYIYDI
jgi:hypothetical protein